MKLIFSTVTIFFLNLGSFKEGSISNSDLKERSFSYEKSISFNCA